jgi:Lsr2
MTIAALRRLLDEELPDVPRHPAPRLPRRRFSAKDTPMDPVTTAPPPSRSAVTEGFEPLPEDQLLDWGDAHSDPDVQDQAARARAALAGLRRRYATDGELTAITTETDELEKRLAELRARAAELAPAPAKGRRTARERDYDPKQVRRWAQEHGLKVPPRGQIPKATLEAWRSREQEASR